MKSLFRRVLSLPKYVLILIGALILLRAALPSIAKYSINRFLGQNMESYTGSIEDFDLSLYRGAYQVQGFRLSKRQNPEPPLISIQEIDLSLAWRALFQGRVLVDATFRKPEVFLVDSKNKKQKQFGTEEKSDSWQKLANVMVPVMVESLSVRDGAAYFSNPSTKVPLKFRLNDIEIDIRNVSNADGDETKLPSSVAASGYIQGQAPLFLNGQFNVMKKKPDLDVKAELKKFDLKLTNPILMTYGPLSFNKGTLGGVAEVKAVNGKLSGYIKPHLEDVDLVSSDEKFKSLKHLGVELVAAAGNLVLRNTEDQSVLTKFEIEGTVDNPGISAPEWFKTAWGNAFGEPESKGFEKH